MRHAVSALILLFAGLQPVAGEPVVGTPASVPSFDGTKIAITYYAREKPGPGILLLHQCNRDRTSWNALAESLAGAGFHVLTMDFRGFGESGGARRDTLSPAERGRMMDEDWPRDVDAAFAYLRAQPGVQQTYGAAGASCGVYQSILLSKRHAEVKSLVLLSGQTDGDTRRHLRSPSSPPLMLAVADDDSWMPRIMGWTDACSGKPTNRFVEYKTGGHGTEMFKSHPDLMVEIVAWYEATLSGRGKPASTDNQARRNSPEVSILMMTDEPGGFGRAVEVLNAERKKDPKSPALEAPFVNFLGYQAIEAKDTKSAIAIMQMNVEARPGSSNAWDSLGDAYLADGQTDKAREASEKSLKLVDSDPDEPEDQRKLIRESAQGRLEKLKVTPAPN